MKPILTILTAILLMTSCQHQKGLEQVETGNKCKANLITKEQLADLLYSDGIDNVQFIDIRTPHQYAVGHLPGAINVPKKNFFNPAYFSKINKDAVLMIYGDDASDARLLALMAGHFKKGNFNVILGGYDYIKNKIIDKYAIYSGLYDDEEALVDYQKFIDELRSRAGSGSAAPKAKPAAAGKPIIKHKKKEVTGGCG